jgi:hypothetical protein
VKKDELKGEAEEFKDLAGRPLNFRCRVHNESPQNVDNFIEFIPDIIFLDQGENAFHQRAEEEPDFFARFKQFDDHFRFLTGCWPHFFWNIRYSFEISAIGSVCKCGKDIGQENPNIPAS